MTPPEPFSQRATSGPHLRVVTDVEPTTQLEGSEHDRMEMASAPLSLEEAYRRFAPYVAAIGMRIIGRADELDDLVQDVFVEATRGIASLMSPEALKGWLARIAVRTSVRRLRRGRLFRALHLQLDDARDYDTLASPDATPEQRALIARVYQALDTLSAADRAAWVLRHVQGETLEQAAELCACSLSTYQRRLRRASAQLDKELPHA
jgi:RNA polymerase sigma-70 factor (ECF subfamily)